MKSQVWLNRRSELWDLLSDMDGSVESILEHSESLIEHSCQVKRKMVVEDELDNESIRLFLNCTIGRNYPSDCWLWTCHAW